MAVGTGSGPGDAAAGTGGGEVSVFSVVDALSGALSGVVCSGTAADGAGVGAGADALAAVCPISSNNHAGVFGLFLDICTW